MALPPNKLPQGLSWLNSPPAKKKVTTVKAASASPAASGFQTPVQENLDQVTVTSRFGSSCASCPDLFVQVPAALFVGLVEEDIPANEAMGRAVAEIKSIVAKQDQAYVQHVNNRSVQAVGTEITRRGMIPYNPVVHTTAQQNENAVQWRDKYRAKYLGVKAEAPITVQSQPFTTAEVEEFEEDNREVRPPKTDFVESPADSEAQKVAAVEMGVEAKQAEAKGAEPVKSDGNAWDGLSVNNTLAYLRDHPEDTDAVLACERAKADPRKSLLKRLEK